MCILSGSMLVLRCYDACLISAREGGNAAACTIPFCSLHSSCMLFRRMHAWWWDRHVSMSWRLQRRSEVACGHLPCLYMAM
jgi:hypothetical protein